MATLKEFTAHGNAYKVHTTDDGLFVNHFQIWALGPAQGSFAATISGILDNAKIGLTQEMIEPALAAIDASKAKALQKIERTNTLENRLEADRRAIIKMMDGR